MTEKQHKWLFNGGRVLFIVFASWQVLHLLAPSIAGPWPLVFWAGSIQGQVVDADTGAPLEGAVITARWGLQTQGWVSGPAGLVTVLEAVTEQDGRYTIPAWGPRFRWPLHSYIYEHEPVLLVFKSGYGFLSVSNLTLPDGRHGRANEGAAQHSVWDGEVIRLKRFSGSRKEYSTHVSELYNRFNFAFRHKDCSWRQIPYMLAATIQEKSRLDAEQGSSANLAIMLERQASLLDYFEDQAHAFWCGSLKEHLRDYLK